jgi:hypothetical protein
MTAPPRTLLITCGALAKEVVALVRDNGWDSMQVKCLPAHIHNTPERIPDGVRKLIQAGREDFEQILVLFADCGTGGLLDEVLAEEDVPRIGGSHCYEVFAGPEAYAELMANEPGSFFLTDFLARHFERLIVKGLALDRHPKLRDIYFGKYRKLVYLTQKETPELRARAEAAAARLGLAFEARTTGYGGYREFLETHQA